MLANDTGSVLLKQMARHDGDGVDGDDDDVVDGYDDDTADGDTDDDINDNDGGVADFNGSSIGRR